MTANKKLLVLAGDGIGPEVMGEVERVAEWLGQRRAVAFDLQHGLVDLVPLPKDGSVNRIVDIVDTELTFQSQKQENRY